MTPTPRIVDVDSDGDLDLTVIADPTATVATLTGATATTRRRGDHWTITIPTPHAPAIQAGHITATTIHVTVTGARPRRPRAVLRVPATTVVRTRITTGRITTTGPLAELAVTGNVDVHVDVVGRMTANTTGHVTVGTITGASTLMTTTGTITVRQGGRADHLIATTGHITYTPGPTTTRVTARTTTGNINLPAAPGVDAHLATTTGHITR